MLNTNPGPVRDGCVLTRHSGESVQLGVCPLLDRVSVV